MSSLSIGFIGDSLTLGSGTGITQTPDVGAQLALAKLQGVNTVTSTNKAVASTNSGQWISGNSNLSNANTSFSSASVTVVFVCLGTYDSQSTVATSAAQYLSNLSSTVSYLTSHGYHVILNQPPCLVPSGNWNSASLTLLQSYAAQLSSLVNNTTIFLGDVVAYNYFNANQSEIDSSGVTLTQTGYNSLAVMWTEAYRKSLLHDAYPTMPNNGAQAASGNRFHLQGTPRKVLS